MLGCTELHGQDGVVPATFQVIYMVSYVYRCDLSSHSMCEYRLGGSPHHSSRGHWKGVRAKQVSKISCNEKQITVQVHPEPYSRYSPLPLFLLAHCHLEIYALE
jgi:hypothetical protein